AHLPGRGLRPHRRLAAGHSGAGRRGQKAQGPGVTAALPDGPPRRRFAEAPLSRGPFPPSSRGGSDPAFARRRWIVAALAAAFATPRGTRSDRRARSAGPRPVIRGGEDAPLPGRSPVAITAARRFRVLR